MSASTATRIGLLPSPILILAAVPARAAGIRARRNPAAGAAFVRGDLRTGAAAILADGVDAVLHFAAKSLVAESVAEPARYWSGNLGGTLALLEAMRAAGTRSIVFSSTAAVYGEPGQVPITETAPPRPASPYGASKLAVDTALAEHARLHRIGAVSLRYFNVAGAHR